LVTGEKNSLVSRDLSLRPAANKIYGFGQMRLAEELDGGGRPGRRMTADFSLRVLALVTDGFGGHGGVAQYNCHFLSSLAACDRIGEVIVLPRVSAISPHALPWNVRQLLPVQGRVAYSFAALRAARAHRPIDIVFCGHLFMAPLAAALAKLFCAKLWIQVHGIEAWQALAGLHRRSVERAVLVTSVSRYTRRRLLEWVGIDPAWVKVLPNTVDPRFQPGRKSDILLARHHAQGKKVLMTVGRLASSERYKGHDQVIRILPRVLSNHPETIYLIVGDGEDRARLEALAVEFGVAEKVEFVGHIDAEQLPDYFRLADIFVMPSTGEGFGIVFLEAMASGIAVIGGNRDASLDPLADGVLGTAVDPVNQAQLESAICAALRTPHIRINHASRFGIEAFSEHLYALVRASFTPR
jgi:phosphatidylinositol alpha-1,6-mannosyltransferase